MPKTEMIIKLLVYPIFGIPYSSKHNYSLQGKAFLFKDDFIPFPGPEMGIPII